MKDFKGKVAVITGTGRGMGRGMLNAELSENGFGEILTLKTLLTQGGCQ